MKDKNIELLNDAVKEEGNEVDNGQDNSNCDHFEIEKGHCVNCGEDVDVICEEETDEELVDIPKENND